MRIIKILIAMLFVFLPLHCFAQSPTDQLVTLLGNLNSLQATFNQTVYDGNGNALQNTQGTMDILRPGKFRWETKSPARQLLIADGKRIWFYDMDLAQVTVQRQQKAQGGSPAILLSGSVQELAQDFTISALPTKGNSVAFKLLPRNKNGMFQQLELRFANNKLHSMKLLDNLTQSTEIIFSNVVNNPNLDPSIFSFTPPKGVDVVNQ